MEKTKYKILALKYRPKNFKELIGQDIMVETLVNSIKSNRIAQAFMLTGERGTGKTSTARIISKSLTCTGNFLEGVKCKAGEICHCEEITNDKHLDVIEYNAANATGVDSIREIIASGKYKPTTAKYKIYIVDECHMLSSSSWNALLKTLEEPPETLRFVMCTTEPKKVPLTIKSRCTQFTLHRASTKVLFDHLKKISKIENGKISDDALMLLSKAAAGSIRDAISLLETALLSNNIEDKEVDTNMVRKMLGIADRSKILELLQFVLQGDQKKSIEKIREMINEGIDPANFLNDFLEILYFIQRKKDLGNFESDLSVSESELQMIDQISKDTNTSTIILFWQFVLNGLEKLFVVANPSLSLEMLIIKLIHLKGMPSYEEAINTLHKNNLDEGENNMTYEKNILGEESDTNNISKNQIKSTIQTKPRLSPLPLEEKNLIQDPNVEIISCFEDLIKLSSKKKEVELKYDLERNVNLVKFTKGKIDIGFNENLGKNFVRNLSEKLLEWTGKRWVITLTKTSGQKTFSELKSIRKKELLEKEVKGEIYKKFKDIFTDAELVDISKKE